MSKENIAEQSDYTYNKQLIEKSLDAKDPNALWTRLLAIDILSSDNIKGIELLQMLKPEDQEIELKKLLESGKKNGLAEKHTRLYSFKPGKILDLFKNFDPKLPEYALLGLFLDDAIKIPESRKTLCTVSKWNIGEAEKLFKKVHNQDLTLREKCFEEEGWLTSYRTHFLTSLDKKDDADIKVDTSLLNLNYSTRFEFFKEFVDIPKGNIEAFKADDKIDEKTEAKKDEAHKFAIDSIFYDVFTGEGILGEGVLAILAEELSTPERQKALEEKIELQRKEVLNIVDLPYGIDSATFITICNLYNGIASLAESNIKTNRQKYQDVSDFIYDVIGKDLLTKLSENSKKIRSNNQRSKKISDDIIITKQQISIHEESIKTTEKEIENTNIEIKKLVTLNKEIKPVNDQREKIQEEIIKLEEQKKEEKISPQRIQVIDNTIKQKSTEIKKLKYTEDQYKDAQKELTGQQGKLQDLQSSLKKYKASLEGSQTELAKHTQEQDQLKVSTEKATTMLYALRTQVHTKLDSWRLLCARKLNAHLSANPYKAKVLLTTPRYLDADRILILNKGIKKDVSPSGKKPVVAKLQSEQKVQSYNESARILHLNTANPTILGADALYAKLQVVYKKQGSGGDLAELLAQEGIYSKELIEFLTKNWDKDKKGWGRGKELTVDERNQYTDFLEKTMQSNKVFLSAEEVERQKYIAKHMMTPGHQLYQGDKDHQQQKSLIELIDMDHARFKAFIYVFEKYSVNKDFDGLMETLLSSVKGLKFYSIDKLYRHVVVPTIPDKKSGNNLNWEKLKTLGSFGLSLVGDVGLGNIKTILSFLYDVSKAANKGDSNASLQETMPEIVPYAFLALLTNPRFYQHLPKARDDVKTLLAINTDFLLKKAKDVGADKMVEAIDRPRLKKINEKTKDLRKKIQKGKGFYEDIAYFTQAVIFEALEDIDKKPEIMSTSIANLVSGLYRNLANPIDPKQNMGETLNLVLGNVLTLLQHSEHLRVFINDDQNIQHIEGFVKKIVKAYFVDNENLQGMFTQEFIESNLPKIAASMVSSALRNMLKANNEKTYKAMNELMQEFTAKLGDAQEFVSFIGKLNGNKPLSDEEVGQAFGKAIGIADALTKNPENITHTKEFLVEIISCVAPIIGITEHKETEEFKNVINDLFGQEVLNSGNIKALLLVAQEVAKAELANKPIKKQIDQTQNKIREKTSEISTFQIRTKCLEILESDLKKDKSNILNVMNKIIKGDEVLNQEEQSLSERYSLSLDAAILENFRKVKPKENWNVEGFKKYCADTKSAMQTQVQELERSLQSLERQYAENSREQVALREINKMGLADGVLAPISRILKQHKAIITTVVQNVVHEAEKVLSEDNQLLQATKGVDSKQLAETVVSAAPMVAVAPEIASLVEKLDLINKIKEMTKKDQKGEQVELMEEVVSSLEIFKDKDNANAIFKDLKSAVAKIQKEIKDSNLDQDNTTALIKQLVRNTLGEEIDVDQIPDDLIKGFLSIGAAIPANDLLKRLEIIVENASRGESDPFAEGLILDLAIELFTELGRDKSEIHKVFSKENKAFLGKLVTQLFAGAEFEELRKNGISIDGEQLLEALTKPKNAKNIATVLQAIKDMQAVSYDTNVSKAKKVKKIAGIALSKLPIVDLWMFLFKMIFDMLGFTLSVKLVPGAIKDKIYSKQFNLDIKKAITGPQQFNTKDGGATVIDVMPEMAYDATRKHPKTGRMHLYKSGKLDNLKINFSDLPAISEGEPKVILFKNVSMKNVVIDLEKLPKGYQVQFQNVDLTGAKILNSAEKIKKGSDNKGVSEGLQKTVGMDSSVQTRGMKM